MLSALASFGCWLLVALDAVVPPDDTDSDADGLSDRLERRTGTSHLRTDSDGDGIRDGDEDVNRNGRVDAHESDPRRPGLFPGAHPHIPEPLHFDLIRALGARAGEIETNVLLSVRPRRGRFDRTTWAPEVEFAVRDGLAFELELPMVDRELHALKAAGQWTAPSPAKVFAHGIQVIGEYLLDERHTEVTALYLAGVRAGRLSAFTMVGPRLSNADAHAATALVNPSVFVDLNEAVTLGLETNFAVTPGGSRSGLALGQMHWQILRRLRVQWGAGIAHDDGRTNAILVSRWIVE